MKNGHLIYWDVIPPLFCISPPINKKSPTLRLRGIVEGGDLDFPAHPFPPNKELGRTGQNNNKTELMLVCSREQLTLPRS